VVASPTEISVTASPNEVTATCEPAVVSVTASPYETTAIVSPQDQEITVSPNNFNVLLQTPGPQGPPGECCDETNTVAAVVNVSVPLANTEYSYALPANCRGFLIKSRGNATTKFGYATGVLTNYVTIPMGAVYEDFYFYSSQTIYFATNLAGNSMEIVTYT
jgi:hypothetical protein